MKKRYPFLLAGAAVVTPDHSAETQKTHLAFSAANWQELLQQVQTVPGLPDAVYDNYRRAGDKAKAYILASVLALHDAGTPSGGNQAVIDISREGCHEQNKMYYRDFVEFGREFGRGHLFVGTLPSTPLCEALIAVRFHGPSFYMDTLDRFEPFWQEIALLLTDDHCDGVLAFHYRKDRVLALYFTHGETLLEPETHPDTLREELS